MDYLKLEKLDNKVYTKKFELYLNWSKINSPKCIFLNKYI